jgi:DNA-binding response OmpR family regulator
MSLSVLYVEDDPNDVFFFERAVGSAKLDAKVSAVPDGDIALEWLAGNGIYSARNLYPLPDVLVLDLKLPRLNGFSVLDAIRRKPTLNDLTIVIYSSSLQRKDVSHTLANGASRFIGKTSDCAELIGYLRNLIARRNLTARAMAAQFANLPATDPRATQ